MKKVLTLAALLILTVSFTALAGDKAKAGEKTATGTIATVDAPGKTLTVTDTKGSSWTFQWTDATKVLGGELAEGTAVKVGYTEVEGKMWATWIKVGAAK